jgi:hypothetical protein
MQAQKIVPAMRGGARRRVIRCCTTPCAARRRRRIKENFFSRQRANYLGAGIASPTSAITCFRSLQTAARFASV